MLWLDAHWSRGTTARSTHNTPIHDEIEAVARAGIRDAVFLIDDLRLFPCDDVKERGDEDYPPIDTVCRAIRTIDPGYRFAVLGDVLLAYTGGEGSPFSSVIEGLTSSLLHGSLGLSDDELLEAEEAIAAARGGEGEALSTLLRAFPNNARQSAFFHLWWGLALLGSRKAEAAANEFADALRGDFGHWRVHLYLARARLASGDAKGASEALEVARQSAPYNGKAKELARQIDPAVSSSADDDAREERDPYKRFLLDLQEYERLFRKSTARFKIDQNELLPCLKDRTAKTVFDSHYVYHTSWAARVLAETRPERHVDVGSSLGFVTIVSAFVPVEFYDYRPADLKLSGLKVGHADLTHLRFDDESIPSLSCMHVVEHIGLGRYGDPIDPDGDLKAIDELKRVVRRGGELLFVVPVGRPKVVFNAHRIYAYRQIIEAFAGFELIEFALVPDSSGLIRRASEAVADLQTYGCGCFRLRKKV